MPAGQHRSHIEQIGIDGQRKRDPPAYLQMAWKYIAANWVAGTEGDAVASHFFGREAALRRENALPPRPAVRHNIANQGGCHGLSSDTIGKRERGIVAQDLARFIGREFEWRRVLAVRPVLPVVMLGSLERGACGLRKTILEEVVVRL